MSYVAPLCYGEGRPSKYYDMIGGCRGRLSFGDLGGYVFENFRDMASNII